MQFLSDRTSVGQNLSESLLRSDDGNTPSTIWNASESGVNQQSENEQIIDWSQHQNGLILITSSLLGVPAFLKNYGKGTLSNEQWTFRDDLSPILKEMYHQNVTNENYSQLIEKLMRTSSDLCKAYYTSNDKMLSVKVSDNLQRMQQELERENWPIKFDVSNMPSEVTTSSPLITATRLHIDTKSWSNYGITTQKEYSPYASNAQILTIERGSNAIVSKDAFGFNSIEYNLPYDGTIVSVRLTDITTSNSEQPSIEQIQQSHQESSTFTPLLGVEGVEIPSIKVPFNNLAMEDLLGASNQGWTFIGIQCGGKLQITNQKPLFVDVAAVAVVVYRCMEPPAPMDISNFIARITTLLNFQCWLKLKLMECQFFHVLLRKIIMLIVLQKINVNKYVIIYIFIYFFIYYIL